MSTTKQQFSKFSLVGILSTFYNYLIYKFLYLVTDKIVFASIIGYTIGLFNSYWFGKKWVFRVQESDHKRIICNFLIVYGIGALGSSIIIYLINGLYNNYSLAWLLGTIFAVINNFVGSKYFVFKNH
tara:strand:+ start:1145 stop:1525 length:381 start_codon:yes stop_codon:yes gene_type:complete